MWLIALALCLSAGLAESEGWPMFRGGQALLGVAEGNLPAKLNLLWTCKTDGPVKSSAAISQGRAFIGSNDGNIYAIASPMARSSGVSRPVGRWNLRR